MPGTRRDFDQDQFISPFESARFDQSTGSIHLPFSRRELSMTASKEGAAKPRSTSADLPQERPTGNCGPMCQQSPLGAHGQDMYPQEFVRLVGCSDKRKQKAHATERLH
jgi:hypothetical protein